MAGLFLSGRRSKYAELFKIRVEPGESERFRAGSGPLSGYGEKEGKMGDRAQLMVLKNGRYDIHFDHWGALSLPGYLFWGPKTALAYFKNNEKIEEWLDDVWAEGAALLDLDLRNLLFFGGEDLNCDVRLREEFLSLMLVMWPGWEIRWAAEGQADIADYLGYPRENVLSLRDRSETTRDRLVSLLAEQAQMEEEKEDYVNICLSFKAADGRLKFFRISKLNVSDLMSGGPELAAVCREAKGWPELHLDCFPCGGVHLDEGRRTVEYWLAEAWAPPLAAIEADWESFEVIWLRDDYRRQLSLGEGLLSFQSLSRERRHELLRPIACLEQAEVTHDRKWLATLIGRLGLQGTVTVSPSIFSSRPPKLPSPAARHKKFDEIAARSRG